MRAVDTDSVSYRKAFFVRAIDGRIRERLGIKLLRTVGFQPLLRVADFFPSADNRDTWGFVNCGELPDVDVIAKA